MIFPKVYKPKHSENRLKHEGDLINSRRYYYKNKPNNLHFLLKKRFEWMNEYIKKGDKVLEVGAGSAFSKEFIRKDCKLIITDFTDNNWIDEKVDALKTPYKTNSFDVVFCCNMIHHVPFPKTFFLEMKRILKPGGLFVIQEENCSLMMKFMLRLSKHEGWDYDADVFSVTIPATDEHDLWSANCAIPNILFKDEKKFKKEIPNFKKIRDEYSEFFIFPLSGGVIAKVKVINLPFFMLNVIDKFDNILVKIAPKIFALQRKLVFKKMR